jgi:starch-binding outer membrane protein, SusD/RagB family
MKKLKWIFASAVVSFFVLTSCEDAYNIVQDGELNEEDLVDVAGMQGWLDSAVYGSLSNGSEINFTAVFTDELSVAASNGGVDLELHRFNLNSDDGYAFGIWYGRYQTINRVNRLLRMANRIAPTVPAEDLAQFNEIVGQGRAIRAYNYLQLLAFFSPDMTDSNAMGIMFLGDVVPEVSDDFPRVTNGEIFAAMEADLAFAYANVTNTNYKYVSKNMIDALRARMYLYKGDYALAKQYAQAVIGTGSLTPATPVPANPPTNPHVANNQPGGATTAWNSAFYSTANPPSPYRKMWADLIQGEIIFALARPASGGGESLAQIFTQNTTTASGSPRWEMSRALFNKFTPGDVRRYAFLDPTSQINPNYDQPGVNYIATDKLIIDKYPGRTGAALRNDAKIFRMSEMYFILAECLAHEGNLNGASNSVASVLKQVRDARNFLGAQPLPDYASAADAFADILLERQKELWIEGHRYVDIARLGEIANVDITRHFTDDQIQGVPLTLDSSDYRLTMPIPRAELTANGSIEQNPGY